MVLVAGVPVETLLTFIGIAIGTFVVSRAAYAAIRHYLDDHTGQRHSKVISRTVQYAILAVGLYIGLVEVLQLDLGAFATSLGIITLAIAFSSQQIISNTLAGLMLILRRPYHIDDWIQLADASLYKVKDISLTSTFLRGMNGTVVTVSNSSVISSRIVNYSRSCFIQVPVSLEVPTSSDFGKVAADIMGTLEANPRVLPVVPDEERSVINAILAAPANQAITECDGDLRKFEPRVLITNVTPSTVSLEIRLWIRDIQERDLIRSEIMTALLHKLKPVEVKPAPPPARPDQTLEAVSRLEAEVRALRERVDEGRALEPPTRAR